MARNFTCPPQWRRHGRLYQSEAGHAARAGAQKPIGIKTAPGGAETVKCNMAENLNAVRGCSVGCLSTESHLQELCRLQHVCCAPLGVNRKNICNFEVEYLCDYKRVQDEEQYLVKWKGYPDTQCSWEPRRHLRCFNLLRQFHRDLERELLRRAKAAGTSTSKKVVARCPRRLDSSLSHYVVLKAKQRQRLRLWEQHLNSKRAHPGLITVENEVDLEGPPKDFVYINEYRVGEGVTITKSAVGCKCRDCFTDERGCCPGGFQHKFAYNDEGQVKVKPGFPIYECNALCRCGPYCLNRVVQKGIQYNFCIFRTPDGRGWGVRTLEKIRKNSFVMEYVGEIITSDEAERRGQIYDRQGATYLFDLDYIEDIYTVDAAHYGNISHFVNHSCKPNLQVYNVFIDNQDERLPRIAFFSTRTIRTGEELTFDYRMQVDPVDVESTKMDTNFGLAGLAGSPKKRVRVECKCGANSCRKYLF